MTIWLLQLPRLDDTFSWGIKEIEHILVDLKQAVHIIDINHAITDHFHDTPHWNTIEDYGIVGQAPIPIDQVRGVIDSMIKPIQPGDVVLSCVFTVESRSWFTMVHSMLRQLHGTDIILGAGGQGCRAPGESGFTSEWADWTLSLGLSDIMFLGETVTTMRDWVEGGYTARGKQYHQHNKFPPLGHLPHSLLQDETTRRHDIPNYYHYDYRHQDERGVKVHFTQGCVKQCTFCDVWHTWPQFVMREPREVIEEIDHYHRSGNLSHISFPDNTINASNSKFLELLQRFDDWRHTNHRQDLTWSSQFAVKPQSQLTDEMFELIARTRGHISVGFDHVSDRVLAHMKKLYGWQDIQSFIARCSQHDVKISVAIWLVGYPTETDQDFEEYTKLEPVLAKPNTILSHNVSVTTINRNSPLESMVTIDHAQPNDWHNATVNKHTRWQRKATLDQMIRRHNPSYMLDRSTQVRSSR